MELVDTESWILEGVQYSWAKPCFERADLIVVLRTSVWLRDWRILRRYWAWRRTARLSLNETLISLRYLVKDFEFNHGFDASEFSQAMEMLKPFADKIIEARDLKARQVLD